MAFDVLEALMEVLERLEKIEPKIRAKRRSLADQIARASESAPLCAAEGNVRTGLDRGDLFRRSLGSAKELTIALRIAERRRYITKAEYDWIDEPLDRARAMLWRLAR